jgi:hypothetical protein
MGKSWENHGIMGNLWGNHGKNMGTWEIYGVLDAVVLENAYVFSLA